MKVYIFGTGKLYKRYMHLFESMDVLGFVDNNPDKWGLELNGRKIMSPSELQKVDFDYVFLLSIYYNDMRNQLLEMGVDKNKIIDKEHKGFFENLDVTEQFIFTDSKQSENNGKKVLMISHVLNLTGAPVVFCRLAKVLKDKGYEVTVVAEKDSSLNHGVLLYQLLQEHISVILVPDYNLFNVEDYTDKYDIFWVCTLVMYQIVERLQKLNKKVYWWLHETEDVYESLKNELVIPQSDNLYVLSGGWMAAESYKKYSGKSVYRDLLYGMPDICEKDNSVHNSHKIKFGLIAAYSTRKGQDILLRAIENNKWKRLAEFYFVGSFPIEIQEEYKALENVYFLGEKEPPQLFRFYEEIDVLIAPSLHDPMPVVVTEAMQHKKMCIVSNRVGQSKYITPMVDGLICEPGSVKDLEEKINWVINNRVIVKGMGEKSYEIYMKDFSMESFQNNIDKLFEDTLK